MKDIVKRLEESLDYEFDLSYKDRKEVLEYIKKIQDRIDKAIEYITSEESINMFTSIDAREEWLKINYKLLNILKGD